VSALDLLLEDIRRWHRETIAPNVDIHGSWAKVQEEFHELAEAVEALDESDMYILEDRSMRDLFAARRKELADLFITLLCYADFAEVNLQRAVAEVHQQNVDRVWSKREDGSMHHD